MLNQKLQQKLLQKLSPQQIQLIKLLEIPTIQLEQRIKREIEENPVLEEGADADETPQNDEENYDEDYDNDGDDSSDNGSDNDIDAPTSDDFSQENKKDRDNEEFTLEDYIEDEETPSYRLNANNYSRDDDDSKNEVSYSQGSSLHDYLISQLGLSSLDERQKQLAEYLIGNIDEDGYLRRDLESVADDLAFSANVSTDENELLRTLSVIQDFDPAGVGARDIRECLMLQIARKYHTETDNRKIFKLALLILRDYFDEFTKKHYDKIVSKTDMSENDLKTAVDEIIKLNPKPGSISSGAITKTSQHIIPDFVLEENDGELILHLNSKNVPELRINRTYAAMLDSMSKNKKQNNIKEKEAATFVKQKLDSAKWFIDAIRQRQNTLMITMQAIIDYQKEYFTEGDDTKLKPMILKDIAENTGFDISTISRVANSKYIQTHFGIMPLKYFFSEGMQTDSGEEVSTREIKKILKECIDGESKKHPLTDEKLAQILQKRGYQIARRTVAKYREQMNILVARLRKEL